MQKRKFKDLMEFAKYLQKVTRSFHGYETAVLHYLGEYLVTEAKGYIGHLQTTNGFISLSGSEVVNIFGITNWKPLAESTKRDKERKGYVFNQDYNPLYRTGELKDSIGYVVSGIELSVGSTSEIMVYQEMGTIHIPPRPVLALAFYKNKIAIERGLGDMLYYWLTQQIPLFRRPHI